MMNAPLRRFSAADDVQQFWSVSLDECPDLFVFGGVEVGLLVPLGEFDGLQRLACHQFSHYQYLQR